ncbi:hypothetical protein JOF42_002351 [Microbacterium phyllosphaerae]|uniref:Uncharacterized protein n=1 Tax=Microbacterium phyllosphaerae TaxID=124798 RepID=A0ABS4WRR8_9MICO|nr:hypothetical protein [Microbacterium phyllosphaerae]MBP2378856.1 hypothetical protein [Microbacterium phyllosphaerae]
MSTVTTPTPPTLSEKAESHIRNTTWTVAGIAFGFVLGTAALVYFPPSDGPLAIGFAILLGLFVIAAGGAKEIFTIREREIRLEIAELPEDTSADDLLAFRKMERKAGDWASACGLYAWIFGLGVVFSAWLKLSS